MIVRSGRVIISKRGEKCLKLGNEWPKRYGPAQLVEAFVQHVAAEAVALADFVDTLLGALQRLDGRESKRSTWPRSSRYLIRYLVLCR